MGAAAPLTAAALWRGNEWLRRGHDEPVVVVGSGGTAIMASAALLASGARVLMIAGGRLENAETKRDQHEYQTSPDTAFSWPRA